MRIVVSGGTGLIGSAVCKALLEKSHSAVLLTRNMASAKARGGKLQAQLWDGKTAGEWAKSVNSADAVINLAGEPIAAARWTSAQKERIINSRVDATRALVDAIKQARKKPSALINASAVGYYGDVKDGDVPETHPKGTGFLADTCDAWEKEAMAAEKAGVRVLLLRTGIVVAPDGGALSRMLLPFKLFMGGPLGTGRQWFPWIHRDDVVNIILFALQNEKLSGPVNVTAPEPVTMKTFCRALGKALNRPSFAAVPSFVLRMALGEMSEMLLTGCRAIPEKLESSGYEFTHPHLDKALASML